MTSLQVETTTSISPLPTGTTVLVNPDAPGDDEPGLTADPISIEPDAPSGVEASLEADLDPNPGETSPPGSNTSTQNDDASAKGSEADDSSDSNLVTGPGDPNDPAWSPWTSDAPDGSVLSECEECAPTEWTDSDGNHFTISSPAGPAMDPLDDDPSQTAGTTATKPAQSTTTNVLPGRGTSISGTLNIVIAGPTAVPPLAFLPQLTGSTTVSSGQTLILVPSPTTVPVATSAPSSHISVDLPGRPILVDGKWEDVLPATTIPARGLSEYLPGLTGVTTMVGGQTMVVVAGPTTVLVSGLVPAASVSALQTTLISGALEVILPGSKTVPIAEYLHGQVTMVSGTLDVVYSASATVPLDNLLPSLTGRTTIINSQTYVVLAHPTTIAINTSFSPPHPDTNTMSIGISVAAVPSKTTVINSQTYIIANPDPTDVEPGIASEEPNGNPESPVGTGVANDVSPGKSSGSVVGAGRWHVVLALLGLTAILEA